jgi:type I restriction enzyme S subunit
MIETNFKHTDIGVIPHDWEVRIIKDFADITTGSQNTQDRIDNGEYPFFVRSSKVERINKYVFDTEGVITAGDGVGTGKIYHYINGKFGLHQRCYLVYNFERVSAKYFYRIFGQHFYDRVQGMTAKSSVDSVRMEMIADMPIPLPPTLAEQEKIANALSKIDQLINDLGALIEKKKAIKQGTMQDLLTAKRRLKGFTGEWKSVKLGDLLEYKQPTKYLVSSKEYTTQGVPVLTAGKTFILGYTQENWGLYDDLPVIIFDDFVVESKYVTMPFKVKSSAIKMLSLREKENDLRFIFEKMQCIEFPIADHKRHWISEYSQLEITIPEPNEQRAIANILSSMDTEITNLEQKRDKYIAIKQGMMQNLLTGKIRLI